MKENTFSLYLEDINTFCFGGNHKRNVCSFTSSLHRLPLGTAVDECALLPFAAELQQ